VPPKIKGKRYNPYGESRNTVFRYIRQSKAFLKRKLHWDLFIYEKRFQFLKRDRNYDKLDLNEILGLIIKKKEFLLD